MNIRTTIQIRPPRPNEESAIALLHDTCWRATYRDLMPPLALERSSLAAREAMWGTILARPPAARYARVAEDDAGDLVGCAWGGAEESGDPAWDGELLGLYLRADWQGHGVGRRLFGAVAADLRRQGHSNLLLWALANNARARGFYAALGGALVCARETVAYGVTLPEVAYGWPDLDRLIARAGDDAGDDETTG